MTVRTLATDLALQRRRIARRFGDLATGAGLWTVIIGFCLWAAVAETDAFVVGVVVGSVLVLGAIGLTLIYGVLKFAHFAHGDAMMLAAYIAFVALTGTVVGARTDVSLPWSLDHLPEATTPIWDFSFGYALLLAIPVAALATVAVFLALEALVYGPLRRRRAGIVIFAIASLGIAIAMRSFVLAVWGPSPRFYVQGIRPTIDLPFGPRIVTDQIFIFGVAIALVALVYLLLFRTRIGRAMRATADNAELARVAGIDTGMVIRWTWVFSAALVAIAGVLLGLQSQLKPELGFVLLLPLFAAAVLGGIGSPQGALAGGFFVGIAQEVAVTFDFLSPGYKFSVAFVILIFVILIRPRGLFGTQT
jgi:branched-chain amino acid transport system permease protein